MCTAQALHQQYSTPSDYNDKMYIGGRGKKKKKLFIWAQDIFEIQNIYILVVFFKAYITLGVYCGSILDFIVLSKKLS